MKCMRNVPTWPVLTVALICVAVGGLACDPKGKSSDPFYAVMYHHERGRIPLAPPYEVRVDKEDSMIVAWDDQSNMGKGVQSYVDSFEVQLPYAYGKLTQMQPPWGEGMVDGETVVTVRGSSTGSAFTQLHGKRTHGLWFILDTEAELVDQYTTEQEMLAALQARGVSPRKLRTPMEHFEEFQDKGELHWFPKPSTRP